MLNIPFSIDLLALLLMAAFCALVVFARQFFMQTPKPSLGFSLVQAFPSGNLGRAKWAAWPQRLYPLALGLFILAFLDPHLTAIYTPQQLSYSATEGLAIYLVLDRSSSMNQSVPMPHARQEASKFQLLKQFTEQFVKGRPNDLIGVVAFARVPTVIVPLTLDHQAVQKAIQGMQTAQGEREDGTAMGYAIFKTANLIAATRHFAEQENEEGRAAYNMKNAIMIVVTDGFQDPSRLDRGHRLRTLEVDDAAAYAQSQHIRLYVINVDPKMGTPEFAPHRRQMQEITQLTGGQFYLANQQQGLPEIFKQIDQLEKSRLPTPPSPPFSFRWISFYPWLIAMGLLSLLIAYCLDTTWLRRTP